MKHLFIMLLAVCSAITTVSAQQRAQASTQKAKPENVIKSFEFIIDLYGQKTGETYSVEKNPNTGLIESSERIVSFVCKKDEPYIKMMGDDFMKDEPLSYQIKHITPGENSQNFTLAVHTNTPNEVNHYAIRTKQIQEMWYMACKNPDNPSLRDAYAIVWQPTSDNKVKGTIYIITSPRPSNFGKTFESSANNTNIGNVVGEVVDEVTDDVVGVVVDGEAEVDTVAIDEKTINGVYFQPSPQNNYGAQAIPVAPQPNQGSNWEPAPAVKIQVEGKAMAIKAQMDAIKNTYVSMKPYFDAKRFEGIDRIFAQIAKQNKALDENFHDFVKTLKNIDTPPIQYAKRAEVINSVYKEILKFYTEQNQGFTEIIKEYGTLPKGIQKTQKALNKLIEKNIAEMGNVMAGMK